MKLAVIHIALLFLFGLPADAAPKYRIRWVVAHGPFNLIEEATTRFAESGEG